MIKLFAAMLLLVFAVQGNAQVESKALEEEREGKRKTPPSIDEIFEMDANGDGKLAKSEIKGKLAKNFDKIDTDGDGFITRAELKKGQKSKKKKGKGSGSKSKPDFSTMDANGDGYLAKDEIRGPLQRDFDKVDTNGDGLISKEELESAPKPERGQGPQQGRN